MRSLNFSDASGHVQAFSGDGLQDAFDAFWAFIADHRTDDNTTFHLADATSGEVLVLLFGSPFCCRVTGSGDAEQSEFRITKEPGDLQNLTRGFLRRGFAGLERYGPWLPDADTAMGELYRLEFDRSPLRRTHPRELRRRLDLLTRIDGREPRTTDDGTTHYAYSTGEGDTVDAWFASAGRGLVVIFDHTSALATSDATVLTARYDGVPADLLDLVPRDSAGGSLPAATGVFHFSAPCAMSAGLVSQLQQARLPIAATGVERLLDGFLTSADLTPDAVATAGPWWTRDQIARGFSEAPTTAPAPSPVTDPAERAAIDGFCKIWADSGYNDPWGVHHILFDSYSLEEVGPQRDELLQLVETMGLELVDTPPRAATGEVWVHTDPRIDAELEHWA
ncbi:DUF6357 family protein [Propionibacteriaceae bacterium Y2011]|uniref:DUF6357 family protein n=1 Tax=Microlunatus sp. Y2014 TaxID=3418488 RepID=UPI003B4F07CC